MYISFLYGILTVSFFISPVLPLAEIPTIAVIGGGIGGTATAYFLRQLFGEDKVKIHLYERERIGGRLATVPIDHQYYETGGAIIHPKNKYMQSFVKTFGLKHRTSDKSRRMGLYSGQEFVFEESYWSLLSYFRLFRRYGFSVYKINGFIEGMLNNFDRIYALQNKGESFDTVQDLLNAMSPDFTKFINISAKKGLEGAGFPSLLVDELVAATTQVNYGQPPTDIHKFVGMVSLAGATGNLWAVEGGNFKVPLRLLEYSGAQLLTKNVLKVSLESNGKLTLTAEETGEAEKQTQMYDAVIVCAPQANNTKNNLDLSDFENKGWRGEYQRIISTILQGRLNHSFFGYNQEDDIPEEILMTSNSLFFNSVGRLSPVQKNTNDSDVNVWKVFSPKPLTDTQLNLLFIDYDRKSINSRDWHAYPHYKHPRSDDSFIIHDNVFYLNVIEWAASAMEMSAIGAKNVALLAFNSYSKRTGNRKNRINQGVVSGAAHYEL